MSNPYPRCASCGDLIGPKIDIYLTELQKIIDNPKLNDEQKQEKKVEVLRSLGFTKYCCVPRSMGSRYNTELIK
jgi:DNA-directed RNA polymerase subunit N (RpoN/RPB10)